MAVRPMFKLDGKTPRELARLSAALLTGLVAENCVELTLADTNGRPFPPLYRSGVRYKREPPGREEFQSAAEVLATGQGDCEDLASWRVAELQRAGVDARVAVRFSDTGGRMMHVVAAVKNRPLNVMRWHELTARQTQGVTLPGPNPTLVDMGNGWLVDDPSKVLGM